MRRLLLALALLSATAPACTPKRAFIGSMVVGTFSGGMIGHEVDNGRAGITIGAIVGLLCGALVGGAVALNLDQARCTDRSGKRC